MERHLKSAMMAGIAERTPPWAAPRENTSRTEGDDMPMEAMLALGSFVVLVLMWVVLPSRLHRGHRAEE